MEAITSAVALYWCGSKKNVPSLLEPVLAAGEKVILVQQVNDSGPTAWKICSKKQISDFEEKRSIKELLQVKYQR